MAAANIITPLGFMQSKQIRKVVFRELNEKRELTFTPFTIYGTIGAPWFLESELCSFFGVQEGYVNSEHTKSVSCVTHNRGRPRHSQVVDTVGFQELFARSMKPNAELFRDWMFEEVLPTIAKTGNYNNPPGPTLVFPYRTDQSVPSVSDASVPKITPAPESVSEVIDAEVIRTNEVDLRKRKSPELVLRDIEILSPDDVGNKVRKLTSLIESLTEPLKKMKNQIDSALGTTTPEEKKELFVLLEKQIYNELKNQLNSFK
jgi:hypothetical protein